MREFEFAIVADGLTPDDDAFEDRFFEAGCSDALIIFAKGTVILKFAREAADFLNAVASAIHDVHKAGARVRRVEPDPYVSISDIAERAELTRQAVSLFANGARGPGDFPAPRLRVTSDSPLWDWAEVAQWLHRNRKLKDVAVLESAELLRALNAALEHAQSDSESRATIERILDAA